MAFRSASALLELIYLVSDHPLFKYGLLKRLVFYELLSLEFFYKFQNNRVCFNMALNLWLLYHVPTLSV